MGLMYMASWTGSMAQVFFHSLQPIDGCSFTFSVNLIQTSMEALLLLSLELPSMHWNWNEGQGAPLSDNQYGGLELILPSMDLPLPMFFSILFVAAIQINRYTVRLAWRKGGHDPLWPTHSSATSRDKTYIAWNEQLKEICYEFVIHYVCTL